MTRMNPERVIVQPPDPRRQSVPWPPQPSALAANRVELVGQGLGLRVQGPGSSLPLPESRGGAARRTGLQSATSDASLTDWLGTYYGRGASVLAGARCRTQLHPSPPSSTYAA